jgi:hypothetical protein
VNRIKGYFLIKIKAFLIKYSIQFFKISGINRHILFEKKLSLAPRTLLLAQRSCCAFDLDDAFDG